MSLPLVQLLCKGEFIRRNKMDELMFSLRLKYVIYQNLSESSLI